SATSGSVRHFESATEKNAEGIPAEPPPRAGALRRMAPTFVVVTALIALAAWGHTSDWTVPKFSTLFGNAAVAETDWCDEHNVPESQCVECNPKLMPRVTDYGWCAAHGVMQCPFEHPDVAQLKSPPAITPAMLARAERALALRPRAENNSRCNLHLKRIQF